MTADDGIRIEGLTKRFGATEAVVDLHLDIEPGEIFGLLGPNGAGKTTTLSLLSTSLVLGTGFLIFTLSSMHNLTRFGAATAGTIAVAFLADIILAPALLQLFLGRRRGAQSPRRPAARAARAAKPGSSG